MQPEHPGDRFYIRHGVAPPSHEAHGTQEELASQLGPQQHGQWKQQGNIITCGRCPTPHSAAIPVDYILSGTDSKGLPILDKILS